MMHKPRTNAAHEIQATPETPPELTVVEPPEDARAPLTPLDQPPAMPARRRREQVHVAPNLLDLVTQAETPAEAAELRKQRNLNAVVRAVLVVGVALSASLMLLGVGLDLVLRRDLPDVTPNLAEVVQRVLELSPSGFLALGLLILIATPILRVLGSLGTLLYWRDWRYAGIAAIVLAVMMTSILLGGE